MRTKRAGHKAHHIHTHTRTYLRAHIFNILCIALFSSSTLCMRGHHLKQIVQVHELSEY